jgi:hypothetical protein
VPFDVAQSLPQRLQREVAESAIAAATEKSTYHPSFVVVIDSKTLTSAARLLADCAHVLLPFADSVVLDDCDAVARFDIGGSLCR